MPSGHGVGGAAATTGAAGSLAVAGVPAVPAADSDMCSEKSGTDAPRVGRGRWQASSSSPARPASCSVAATKPVPVSFEGR